ncbi:MAG: dTMP kinase [Candidatus Thermoplasmatota archaeon]|nr:dTMP kinase [Candidatus Thermoplasmatota archaeon]
MSRYIVLEGIDGSGKSVISRKIAKSIPASVHTREPTKKMSSTIMENKSLMADVLLFAADRAAHMEDVKKWLGQGKTVVSDRSLYSSMAYQGASLEEAMGGVEAAMDWVLEANRPFFIRPDKVLFLDLPVETALQRVAGRGKTSRFERQRYLEKVRNNYLSISETYGFTIIDASPPIEDVFEACMKELGL